VTTDDGLDEGSRHLLRAVRELAEIEQRKRQQPRSSQLFEQLSAEAEAKALEVWEAARDAQDPEEGRDGDDFERVLEPDLSGGDWTS
jgi:hypothetical protein